MPSQQGNGWRGAARAFFVRCAEQVIRWAGEARALVPADQQDHASATRRMEAAAAYERAQRDFIEARAQRDWAAFKSSIGQDFIRFAQEFSYEARVATVLAIEAQARADAEAAAGIPAYQAQVLELTEKIKQLSFALQEEKVRKQTVRYVTNDAEIAALKAKVKELTERCDRQSSQLSIAQLRQHEMTLSKKNVDDEMSALKATIKRITAVKTTLRDRLWLRLAEIDELTSQKEILEQRIARNIAEHARLRREIEQCRRVRQLH